jgi:hypothetical protein
MIPARFTRRNAICRKPDERRREQAKLQRKTSEEELNSMTAKRRLSTRGNEQPNREGVNIKEVVAVAVAPGGYTNSKPVMPTRYERQPSAQQLEEMGAEFMSLSDLAGMAAKQLESALERGAFSRRLVVDEEYTKKQECIDKNKDSSVSIIPAVSRRRSVISIMA